MITPPAMAMMNRTMARASSICNPFPCLVFPARNRYPPGSRTNHLRDAADLLQADERVLHL
jgi:hypothetical protein